MIKILSIMRKEAFQIELQFSNQETAMFDGAEYLATRKGELLEALNNETFFNRCFLDAGALCWPNGFELSAERVFELSRVLEAL